MMNPAAPKGASPWRINDEKQNEKPPCPAVLRSSYELLDFVVLMNRSILGDALMRENLTNIFDSPNLSKKFSIKVRLKNFNRFA
jgi:hypothetical protein